MIGKTDRIEFILARCAFHTDACQRGVDAADLGFHLRISDAIGSGALRTHAAEIFRLDQGVAIHAEPSGKFMDHGKIEDDLGESPGLHSELLGPEIDMPIIQSHDDKAVLHDDGQV